MHTVSELLDLKPTTTDQIKFLFSDREPFGPSSARGFKDYPDIGRLIFSTENQIWREYVSRPRMIVGRKGAGKTSVLRMTELSQRYGVVHRISISNLLLEIIDSIFSDDKDFKKVPAEFVGKVWTQLINTSLMAEVIRKDKTYKFTRIQKYFDTSASGGGSDQGKFDILRKASKEMHSTLVGEIIELALRFRNGTKVEYRDALLELDEYLSEKNLYTVIILDSIEEYFIDDHQWETALKGLLRCAGAFGAPYRDMRVAIPAELYFELQEISSNLMKDFENVMALHWNPMELLRIVAWRYLIFLAGRDRRSLERFRHVDLTNRDHIHEVLNSFLPQRIVNRSGKEEVGVVYLLRHTQLLPRQVILILNEAFSTVRPNTPLPEDELLDSLKNAVSSREEFFCREIFGAFRGKYPFAQALCSECIKELPRFFSEKVLEQIYKEKGKLILQSQSSGGAADFSTFCRVLFEIGAIGRVKKKTTFYADAEFEYAIPGRLYASRTDELCLHPAFSGAFETNANRTSDLFVYPHMDLYKYTGGRPGGLVVS